MLHCLDLLLETSSWNINRGIEYTANPNVTLIGIRDLDLRLGIIKDHASPWGHLLLLQKIVSLFRVTAFQRLQFVRYLSEKSSKMRSESGLNGYGSCPKVIWLWSTVVSMARDRRVWFQDFDGSNIMHPISPVLFKPPETSLDL